MRSNELDFELPTGLIAQHPSEKRGESRLLHYRTDRSIHHRSFADLPVLLRAGDVLVFNDSKVLPAKFVLKKESGGRVEGLFLQEIEPGRWRVLLKNPGQTTQLSFAGDAKVSIEILQKADRRRIRSSN